MYTEIRELANFLARLFHLPVPKRKIGIFCEHLANICLLRFQPYWNVKQPKQNEEKRIIRITRDFADEIITEAATATAIGLQELANCLPMCLILYINPGEVFYTTSDNSLPVIIWVGSVNKDHNNEKIHKSSLIPPPSPQSLLSTILPQMPAPVQPLCNLFPSLNLMSDNASANGNGIRFANGCHGQNCGLRGFKTGLFAAVDPVPNMADFTGLDARINLELVHPHELGYALTNPYLDFLIFRFVTQGDPKYTAETFANTRFGYFRNRPDREKDLLDAIKDFVNWDTATTTESTTGSGTWSSSSNEGDIWSSSSSPGSSIDRQQQYGNGGTPMV